MSGSNFVIERHRLASDARQFGIWCFRIAKDGTRSVIAYASPREAKDTHSWTVFRARTPLISGVTRGDAEKMLRRLATQPGNEAQQIGGAR